MSERFLVTGGNRLSGEVAVGGAKNSVLKLMAASLLAEGTTTITNCPDILDVPLMAEVLRGLGANVELDGSVVRITSPDEPKYEADFAAVRQFRASVCVLGPLVGRCKRARVALPGGDAIGSRPLDMHQSGLRQLGADCTIEHGCVVASAEKLHGAEIQLGPSVNYGAQVEFGGDIIPVRATRLRFEIDGQVIYARRVHQEPHPYMVPAAQENTAEVVQEITTALQTLLRVS